MKNLLIILLAISPFLGYSQTDSAALKISLSIQARNAEYIVSQISNKDEYEDLYDSAKAKFRVANPPLNNIVIDIDNVETHLWLSIMNIVRKDYLAIQAGIFIRMDAILRAKNNAFIIRKLNEMNSLDTKAYQEARTAGRNRLRRGL